MVDKLKKPLINVKFSLMKNATKPIRTAVILSITDIGTLDKGT